MKSSIHAPLVDLGFQCQVAGWATWRASPADLARLRRDPDSFASYALAPGILKHAEAQTVVGLATVLRAMESPELAGRSYGRWGVVAAPTLFGREGTAVSLDRFRKEGAWGISPHMIPHHSLHAVSGTISQALKIQGPNFGISGGANACAEAFLMAASLLCDCRLPGLWVVLTGWGPEWIPGKGGAFPTDSIQCQAAALALLPTTEEDVGPQLRIAPGFDMVEEASVNDFTLSRLVSELSTENPGNFKFRLPSAGSIELSFSCLEA